MGDALPDVVRWISWGYWNFVRACDRVHFERVTKQRYCLGPVRQDAAEICCPSSRRRTVPSSVSARRDWLVGDHPTYADFRLACVLPFADLAGLPVHDFPRVEAWHARLMDPAAGGIRSRGSTRPNCRQSAQAAGSSASPAPHFAPALPRGRSIRAKKLRKKSLCSKRVPDDEAWLRAKAAADLQI